MENDVYTMTFSDGSKLTRIRKNLSTYVSDDPIDPRDYSDKLDHVTISNGSQIEILENVEMIPVIGQTEDDTWFILRPIDPMVLFQKTTEANIEYLAMMMDVEL